MSVFLGRLPRVGPFVSNLWHCALLPWQARRAKHGKECVQAFYVLTKHV